MSFDWYDETTWRPSLGDADALFLKGLDSDDAAADIVTGLIASAPQVRYVVLMSAMGVDQTPDQAPRRALELAVQRSGRLWTILRPNWFLQNFDEDEWVFARALREAGHLYAASGDRRVSFVDTRDVAAVAVAVLTQDGHHERGYTLTGPDSVTFGHVAEVLGEASGQSITHVDATLTQHREHFARSGRSDAWVDHMMHLFTLIRAGMFAPVSDDIRQLTGDPPRSLDAYAKDVWSR